MSKEKLKRINVEVDDEFHHRVKKAALNHNITIKAYVIRAIVEQIKREAKYGSSETDLPSV